MNTYTLQISAPVNSTIIYDEVDFFDIVNLDIYLFYIEEDVVIKNIIVDWGDGESATFTNRLMKVYREDSIFTEITAGKFSTIFNEDISHKYRIQSGSVYTKLTCQTLIEYSNGIKSLFVLPIKHKTYEFHDAIGELVLINTNLMPLSSNKTKNTYIADKGGFIIENITP